MPKRFQIKSAGAQAHHEVGAQTVSRRLGFAWVIAPVVAGVVIVVAAYFALR
jgi:hypothetical protein